MMEHLKKLYRDHTCEKRYFASLISLNKVKERLGKTMWTKRISYGLKEL